MKRVLISILISLQLLAINMPMAVSADAANPPLSQAADTELPMTEHCGHGGNPHHDMEINASDTPVASCTDMKTCDCCDGQCGLACSCPFFGGTLSSAIRDGQHNQKSSVSFVYSSSFIASRADSFFRPPIA